MSRRPRLDGFATFSLPVRFLLVNHFLGNTGFYLLVPYLAMHLTNDLGLSFALAAIVLSVRNLSHQGLFLVGGSAADRLGAREVIIAGSALRAVGFGLFAWPGSGPLAVGVLVTAAVLSGVAGALFNPAVRAYLSTEAGEERRAEVFALFSAFGQAGALLGPVLGALLLLIDFRVAALTAAAVFAALALAQARLLAHRPVEPAGQSVLADWRGCLRDRRFMAFTLALSGMYALQNQLYFVVPAEVQRLTGSAQPVAAVFVVLTLVTILGQVRITRRLSARRARGPAMTAGLAVMGVGFVLPALAPSVPVGVDPGLVGAIVRLLPVLATVVCLSIGVMVVQPFAYELLGLYGDDRTTGTRFGFFYVVSGVVAAVTGVAIGFVADPRHGWPADLVCVAVGLTCATGVWRLHRRGDLPLGAAPAPVEETTR